MKLGQITGLSVSLEHEVQKPETETKVFTSDALIDDWSKAIDDGLSGLNETLAINFLIAQNTDSGIEPVTAEVTSVAIESIKRRLGIKVTNPILSLESYANPITKRQATEIACEGVSEFLKNIWEGIKEMMRKFWDFIKGLFTGWGKDKEGFGSNPTSTKAVVEKLNAKVENVTKAKTQAKQAGKVNKHVEVQKEVDIPALSRALNIHKDVITVKDMVEYLNGYKKLEAAVYDVVGNANSICIELRIMIEKLIKADDPGVVLENLPTEIGFVVGTPYNQVVDKSELVVDNLLDNEGFYKFYFGGNSDLLFKGEFAKIEKEVKTDSKFKVPESESEINQLIHALTELSREYTHNDTLINQMEESHKIYLRFEAEMDKMVKSVKDLKMIKVQFCVERASHFVSRAIKNSAETMVKLKARRNTLGRSVISYVEHMTKQMVNNATA